MMVAFKKVLGL